MNKHLFELKGDWESRFQASSILWFQIAAGNPERGLVCTNRTGTMQLYSWHIDSGKLTQLTILPAGVVDGLLSATGEYVYFLQDEGGNEIGRYVRVPFEGGEPEDVTPELSSYSAIQLSQSKDGEIRIALVADQSGYSTYVLTNALKVRKLFSTKNLTTGISISSSGDIVVIATTEGSSLDTHLLALDVKSGREIARLSHGEGISNNIGKFSGADGDTRMLVTSNKSGYFRPGIWDPISGIERQLPVDQILGDVHPWGWTKDAKQILLSQMYQTRQQLYLYDLEQGILTKLNHPDGVLGGDIGNAVFTDKAEILLTCQDPFNPSSLIALDSRSGQKQRTVLMAGDASSGRSWKHISFESENGDTIFGWLAVPKGEGPFPTIIHVHGGPSAVISNGFSAESQAWLDQGIAFCSINYHGSITLGKDFENSILGHPGELEVQDIAGAYQWLIQQNIAISDAVFLTGNSYGGYLTLLALGKRPELWAGGMAGVAIADWVTMYADQNDALRGFQKGLFGGTPEDLPQAYKESSPITYSEQVQAPILVIQGRNDTRCPVNQMLAYESKMKSLGKQIKIHWFDAGHWAHSQEEQINLQSIKLKFALRILVNKDIQH